MKTPLRILMVSDVSPLVIRGGAERVLWEVASRLAARGHRIRILSRAPADTEPVSVERAGVSITHFPCHRRSPLSLLHSSVFAARRSLGRLLAAEPCDVLHLWQPLSGYGALRPARAYRLPFLYTFLSPAPLEYASRGGMSAFHRRGLIGRVARVLLWTLERACLRRANRIQVLSDFSGAQAWRSYGVPSDRLVRIPGGADIERFAPARDRDAVRRHLGLPQGVPLLLTVRNLEARMGLDTLVEAMAILRRALPDAVLLIGGTGSVRAQLESQVASLQLQGQVRFLGYVQERDLARYYQAADVFVLPTRELEGFGLITVEALASGTPVLGTAVGATPEILRPLDASFLFREPTPRAMAERLHEFFVGRAQDRNAAEELRRTCRRYVEKEYSWGRAVDRLESTFVALARPEAAEPVSSARCPACGGVFAKTRLLYAGDPYLECPLCHTGRIAGVPTTTALRHRYEVDYPENFPHESIVAPRAAMFASMLDRVAALGRHTRLVDIGCGGGHLLASATQRGWRSFGTDVSHEACTAAKSVGRAATQADAAALPLCDASVDVACLVNTLDHLPDPYATLREAYRVLVPGGHLVIRVPNAVFHRSCVRLFAGLGPLARSRGWDRYPVLHIFSFPPHGLRRIADRAGFRVLQVKGSSLAAECRGERLSGVQAHILRWVFWLIAAQARIVEVISRGRLMTGPAIELYAERPSDDVGGLR